MLKDIIFRVLSVGVSGLGERASILMYHSVGEEKHFFTVRTAEFERQMQYLNRKKFTVVSLTEIVRRIQKNEALDGCVAITFDDGFRDNFINAFPILQQNSFHATIFATTDMIGGKDHKGLEYLTLAEMKEMERSGLISIEPHTKSHPHLARLAAEEARTEIVGSKTVLEEKMQKKCDLFAYPFGSFNDETARVVQESGYTAAVTVKEGTVGEKQNLYRIPRNSIDSTTTFTQFKGKVSSTIDRYNGLKQMYGRV